MMNDKPILSKPKINSPKILSPDETPVRLQGVMEMSRRLGQSMAETSWDSFSKFVDDFMGKECVSGNDALSIATTYVTYFLAVWVLFMKVRIADKDDAGIKADEMIKAIMEGVERIVSTAKLSSDD